MSAVHEGVYAKVPVADKDTTWLYVRRLLSDLEISCETCIHSSSADRPSHYRCGLSGVFCPEKIWFCPAYAHDAELKDLAKLRAYTTGEGNVLWRDALRQQGEAKACSTQLSGRGGIEREGSV